MGKKDAQRTKGNTKAASSARSALVLGENTGFVGFGTAAESGFVPLLQPDDGVPPEFRLVMRKMHKKDVTTKVKAVQEFLDLSLKASEEDMLAVLAFWPSVYTKLAMDTDRRVRELAHLSLEVVVKSVGKNLALHLKALSGVWYISQSDSHQPAAAAATAAWKSAFPPHKLAGAVEFCQREILSLIIENLTAATPATLSDAKTTPPEEMEAKYTRTVSMSLEAYASLLDSVPNPEPEHHKPLLDSAKFWKLSKHKAGNIRKSFFTAVTQLCVKLRDSVVSRAEQAVPAVLGSLGDTEAGDAVWTAALHLLSAIPNAWAFVNPHKAVFPAVWKLLTNGADGFPSRVYPYLMPFLSKVPLTVMEDCEKFTNRWFSSFLTGFDVVNGRRCRQDCETVILSYLECLFYLCAHVDLDQQVKSTLVREHLSQGVRRFGQSEGMFSSLADYLLHWERVSSTNSSLGQLYLLYWSEVKFACSTQDREYYLDFLLRLGRAIQSKQNTKSEAGSRPPAPLVNLLRSAWSQELLDLKAPDRAAQALENMCQIVSGFGTLDEVFGIGTDSKSKIDFYENTIAPLYTNPTLEEPLSRLTWALASILPEEDGLNILETYIKSTRPTVIADLVVAAKSSKGPLFRAWLSSPAVQEFVVEAAHSLVSSLVSGHTQTEENWAVLRTVLASSVPVSATTQTRLFSVFLQGLDSVRTRENKPSSARLVDFVCDLLGLVTISHHEVIAEATGTELVKLIFSLQSLNFSEPTVEKLSKCWTSAVQNQPKLGLALSSEVAERLGQPLSMEDLEKLVVKVESLTSVLARAGTPTLVENLEAMLPQAKGDFAEQAWYRLVFDQQQFLPSVSESFDSSLVRQAEIEPVNLVPANITLTLLTAVCRGLDIEPTDENEARTVADDERVSLPEPFLGCRALVERVCEAPLVVVYMQNLVLDKNCSAGVRALETRLTAAATRLFSRLSKRNLDLVENWIFDKCRDQDPYYNLALRWILGITYRFSEWDLRLNRFISVEDTDIEKNYNTLVSFMELISRYNIGSGTISSSLGLAVGKFISIEGLLTEEGTCLLWFISKCLDLVRTGSRLHISGVSEFSGEIQIVLETVLRWKGENEDQLLYNTDLSVESWSGAVRVCTVCNLLNLMVLKYTELISSQVWDLITCSLVSWVGTLEESKDNLTSRATSLMFGLTIARLAASVSDLLGPKGHHPALSVGKPGLQSEPPPKLREEWAEFFSEGIYSVLVPLYIKVCTGKEQLYSSNLLSTGLGQALVHCPLSLLLQCELPPLYLIQDVDAPPMPDNITFLFNHFGPLLSSSCRSSQVTAAHVLAAVTQEIPKTVDVTGDGEEYEIPRRLLEMVQQGELLLSNLLLEFSISDPVGEIPPGTVVFSQTFGYLVSWLVVLRLLDSSSDEVRPRYSQYLESRGHIPSLLNNIFKLLPASSAQLEAAFSPLVLEVGAEAMSQEIQHLAASCWTQVCRQLPAYARQWWSRLDRESQATVERITCTHVTPALWAQEVSLINTAQRSDNLSLKVRDSVREVVATYNIDEGSMELLVSLPSNYPLGGLTVDSGKRVGVETGQWRKWMLQLTTFLIHQNGSIHEGLNLWKKNVDKRFEGVEECYICFYILHGSNHQLPKLGCRTCKKKFHSACLYKWFSTSNNSSCPLCRNLF